MEELLTGGSVQRVWAGRLAERDLLLIRVRVPGETVHLAIVGGRPRAEVVISTDATTLRAVLRNEADTKAEAKRKAELEGARVVRVATNGIVLEREGRVAVVGRVGATLEVIDAGEAALDDAPVDRAALEARGGEIVDDLARSSVTTRRDAIGKAIAKAAQRLERRAAAVRGDLAKIGDAQSRAVFARQFVPEAVKAPRGATELSTMDWTAPEPLLMTMKLDPSKGAREQLEAIFKRAKRMKEASRIVDERLRATEHALTALDALARELRAADQREALDEIAVHARKVAGKDFSLGGEAGAPAKKRAPQAPLPPYRTFRAGTGAKILVGRGAAQNDDLTMHVARPHDLWLHAKNRTGAHVLVPLEKNASCPGDVLVDAAHLAAHFSDAREETSVEVQYTPKRYLRKPKGSGPGFVIVDREKVLVLRKEPGRVERLLATEEI